MSHLTVSQRYTISSMLKEGFKPIKIAKIIGKDRSVVSRELKRNCDKRSGKYCDNLAQRKYELRQSSKAKYVRFTPSIQEETDRLLRDDLSPEQVVGFLKKENKPTVFHERIYQYI